MLVSPMRNSGVGALDQRKAPTRIFCIAVEYRLYKNDLNHFKRICGSLACMCLQFFPLFLELYIPVLWLLQQRQVFSGTRARCQQTGLRYDPLQLGPTTTLFIKYKEKSQRRVFIIFFALFLELLSTAVAFTTTPAFHTKYTLL